MESIAGDTRIKILGNSGQAWSIAESVVESMRECQSRIVAGDTRGAMEYFRRGHRLAKRVVELTKTEQENP